MVDATIIFIVVIIVIAIIAVIVSYLYIRDRRQATTDGGGGSSSSTMNASGWSMTTDGPSSAHNFCGVYTFPSTNPSLPSPITLNPNVLDNLTPVPFSQVDCVDADQIAAKQVQRTCLGNGVLGDTCYGGDGRQFQKGQTEVLYVECNKTKCRDTLATVALNFEPPISTPAVNTGCLRANNSNLTDPIKFERCNISSSEQLFRIDRQDAMGQNDPSGPYGRIFDRSTGMCVVPTSQNPTVGDKLVLGDCAPASGYVWWFFPPQSVEDPYSGPMMGTTNTAPQQLIYFPNPGKQPPAVGQVSEFIKNNMPVSMAASVNTDGTGNYGQDVTLQRVAVNLVDGQPQNSQTIDYWLYQIISQKDDDNTTGTNFPWYIPPVPQPPPMNNGIID